MLFRVLCTVLCILLSPSGDGYLADYSGDLGLTNFANTRSPILLYQLLLLQDRQSCARNILFLSARSPILSYH